MPGSIEMLQEGIAARQEELQRVADILAKAAQKYRIYAGCIRVGLIFFGAVIATQSSWEKAFPAYKEYSFITFTFLGVIVTTLAGLEAAFKFESRGAELNLLAASCHSTVRKTDATWYKQVGIASNLNDQVSGAMSLIELQDTKLSEIQEKAASSGVNVTLEIRKLYRNSEAPYSESGQSPDRPYAA